MYNRLVSGNIFALVPEDFDFMRCGVQDGREIPFFRLERELSARCGVPLNRGKRLHRWGFYVLLLKLKVWTKVQSGEIE